MGGNSALSRLRRPEYTGDRRCWPCTVVNAAILGVAVVVLALATAPVLAGAVAVLGAGTIWLRGYLVPGTPAFAPRLVGAVPGGEALFGKSPSVERTGSLSGPDGGPDAERLLGVLVDAGVIDVHGEELVLDPGFETGWDDRMAPLSDLSTGELATEVRDALTDGVPEATVAETRAVRDDDTGREWIALSDGETVVEETWVPRPVAIAETAAVRELDRYVDDPSVRREAAASLRLFLEECSDCGTTLEESTTVSCCGGYEGEGVPEETLFCPDCRVQLFVFD